MKQLLIAGLGLFLVHSAMATTVDVHAYSQEDLATQVVDEHDISQEDALRIIQHNGIGTEAQITEAIQLTTAYFKARNDQIDISIRNNERIGGNPFQWAYYAAKLNDIVRGKAGCGNTTCFAQVAPKTSDNTSHFILDNTHGDITLVLAVNLHSNIVIK